MQTSPWLFLAAMLAIIGAPQTTTSVATIAVPPPTLLKLAPYYMREVRAGPEGVLLRQGPSLLQTLRAEVPLRDLSYQLPRLCIVPCHGDHWPRCMHAWNVSRS